MKNAKEKYEYCLKITEGCLQKLEIRGPEGETLLEWINNYYTDAKHYAAKKDYETALEAVAYAHGFIDAGVLLGHFSILGYHLASKGE